MGGEGETGERKEKKRQKVDRKETYFGSISSCKKKKEKEKALSKDVYLCKVSETQLPSSHRITYLVFQHRFCICDGREVLG